MHLRKIVLLVLYIGMLNLTVPGISFAAQKISINFTGIKTRDLLKLLAKHANKNIVISEKIASKITIDLKNISWCKALDTVIKMQGLVKREFGDVVIIFTPDEVEKNKNLFTSQEVISLQHVTAENVAKALRSAGLLSQYGKLGEGFKTNSLLVNDVVSNVNVIKDFVKKVDLPDKQVLIEARIVSADATFLRELGLELNSRAISAHGLQKESTKSNSDRGQFNFAIAKMRDNALLDLQLAALENEGRGRVISKPKLLTTNCQAAYIEAGAEVPYQEKTKGGNTSVIFKKAVLSLKVTPKIATDDKVNLDLQLRQDKVGQLIVNGVPTIDTRKIHTKVLVGNNETVVLGGIYEWTKSSRIKGLPFLSRIPLIGVLFGKKETRVERKELLIFVTPRIVK